MATSNILSENQPQTHTGLRIWPGKPYPLGATWDGKGVNFALYSAHAEAVELLLFHAPGDHAPQVAIRLPEKTGPIWHAYIPELKPGQLYGYRVYGPFQPAHGFRFNPHKVLLDPYAKAIGRPMRWDSSLLGYHKRSPEQDLSYNTDDSASFAPLGAVIDESFDWEGDQRLGIPWDQTVIYETHVKGVSIQHPEVDPSLKGTYLGLVSEPIIQHFKRIGVTTIQLLPVHAKGLEEHLIEKQLTNYWGYNTLAYMAPEPGYASSTGIDAVTEFKQMVKQLHAAGFEVIIDVVYNHTAEGNQFGPTLSFRGIDNLAYYKENPVEPRFLMDYTGTGNTLDAGNPHVLQLIMDSLRYWVLEMHVDGFRFDLASALARDLFEINMLSAFFQIIQQDPVLSQVKLIAEPWDVGPGGYQVGGFPWQWTEWNGKYRDTVRGFWRGDNGKLAEFATRLAGSSDLYDHSGRKPFASINFLTAHDGYTLEDLVSYEQKHNEANKEDNRDGHNDNQSRNYGVEGPTDDPAILTRRARAKRGLIASLLLSQGVPMILGGDELGRTQLGNNNAYCQDNEVNWYNWELDEEQEAFLEYVSKLVALRRAHPNFSRHRFLTGKANAQGIKDVTWWHPKGREMTDDDWKKQHLHAFGMLLHGDRLHSTDEQGNPLRDETFLVLFNAGDPMVNVVLPSASVYDEWGWIEVVSGDSKRIYSAGQRIRLSGNSVRVFIADPTED